MGKKFNKSLLSEELKRFRLLSEYQFHTEDKDNLILGRLGEDEGDEQPAEDAPVDDSQTAANQQDAAPAPEAGTEEPATDAGTEEPAADAGTEEPAPEAGTEEAPVEEPSDDEVEVDVTSLVQGSEEAKEAATSASQKTDELLAKFNDLEARISKMDAISTKINDLEQEIVKRNPTPIEKLEMRSLNSFPYNIKLTDYFKDIDGYDISSEEKEPNEYVLTKDDVDSDYLDQSVKDTFDIPEEDYEEEDI